MSRRFTRTFNLVRRFADKLELWSYDLKGRADSAQDRLTRLIDGPRPPAPPVDFGTMVASAMASRENLMAQITATNPLLSHFRFQEVTAKVTVTTCKCGMAVPDRDYRCCADCDNGSV